jgi:hypothetical protein
MEIITLAAGAVGLVTLALMALAPLLADLPLPRQALAHLGSPERDGERPAPPRVHAPAA